MTDDPAWWQTAVVYQIYPWSFQDSNGDGVGDLAGITSRLDYLNDGTEASLGIDAIWLSPIYPSPMHDFGYDVADYCDIDPRFGTLDDFDRMVTEAHRRGIRIIMDLILNHTSDQHPWFLESRSSRQAQRRDWYYWADGKSLGRRPSNWNARFGASAWTWDAVTRQYYLHSFLKQQPDLNWHHPGVRQAMFDMVRFWLDRGVDGFRLDAINWLGKDPRWPNNPVRLAWRGYNRQKHQHDRDQPIGHEVMRELRAHLRDRPDVMLVGEATSDTIGGPFTYYGDGTNELHMVFDFRLLESEWRADRFRGLIESTERSVPKGGWPPVVFSNHDKLRHIDRYGRGGDAERRAKAAAVILLTLRGTPFLYYGEELGMRNGRLRYRDLRDPYTKRFWPFRLGRDPARTPMQWNASPHAGFTTGRPWLPISGTGRNSNVRDALRDPTSILTLYRRLIQLRRRCPALSCGEYDPLNDTPSDCLVYRRVAPLTGGGRQEVLVAVNFSDRSRTVGLPSRWRAHRVLLSTYQDIHEASWASGGIVLRPDEALALLLE